MARNDPEMQRLQQDAIRRVQEMQNRAQHLNSQPAPKPEARHSEPKPAPEQAGPSPRQSAEKPAAAVGPPPVPAAKNPVADIFEALLKDSDRTLILILLLLLKEEKADTGLLFALLYLAL